MNHSPYIRWCSKNSSGKFFTLHHNCDGEIQTRPTNTTQKIKIKYFSNVLFLLFSILYKFLLPYFPPWILIHVFHHFNCNVFGNVGNSYYIGRFTKTSEEEFTFSKSPPPAPFGSENLRKKSMTPPLDKKDLDPLWGLSYYVTVGTIVSSTHKTITTFSSRENIQSHEYVLQFEGFCMIFLCTRIFLNFFYYR